MDVKALLSLREKQEDKHKKLRLKCSVGRGLFLEQECGFSSVYQYFQCRPETAG